MGASLLALSKSIYYFRKHGYNSAFRFRFYLLFTSDAGGYAISRQNTSSCIWVVIPVDWVILHSYACGADGRSEAFGVRSRDYQIFGDR